MTSVYEEKSIPKAIMRVGAAGYVGTAYNAYL